MCEAMNERRGRANYFPRPRDSVATVFVPIEPGLDNWPIRMRDSSSS